METIHIDNETIKFYAIMGIIFTQILFAILGVTIAMLIFKFYKWLAK